MEGVSQRLNAAPVRKTRGGPKMSPEALRQLLRVQPFRPFRVHLASGHSYIVSSPEWMVVAAPTSALGLPGQAADGDRLILLDNMSITHTEPVDSLPVG